MITTKRYFQDRLVLLLLSMNAFLAFLTIILILFRIGGVSGEGYIVQYRSNIGFSAFKTGSVISIVSFIVFVLLVLTTHILISWKTYNLKRELSITILGLSSLLLLLTTIVSNALLVLR